MGRMTPARRDRRRVASLVRDHLVVDHLSAKWSRYGYLSWREAGTCLVAIPTSARSPKRFASAPIRATIIAYWSSAFWIGLAALSVSLLAAGRQKPVQ